jgi:hypothetical protein
VLKQSLGIDARLEHGPSGSFEVSVGGQIVAQRGRQGFPTDEEILNAVRAAVTPPGGSGPSGA